jgi:hypothetical protein
MPDPDDDGRGLSNFHNHDWWNIPGAVRALTRVVTGLGDVGAAGLDILTVLAQERAQAIRDRTAVKTAITASMTAITASMASAAAIRASQNPALLNRMIYRVLGEDLSFQENREAIAVEAGDLLDELPPRANTEGPSEDWLNVFSSYAENATSETLRAHWAHVLAGEIRSPGTFSLATLQLFSILDPRNDRCREVPRHALRALALHPMRPTAVVVSFHASTCIELVSCHFEPSL